MEINILQFQIQHLFIAYLGMLLHVLTKIEESRKKGELTTVKAWAQENIITAIVSIIMIPIILLIAETDPLVKGYLPINNLTSLLAGWQTESLFKTLINMAGSRLPKESTPA